jgi:hypothetical protein
MMTPQEIVHELDKHIVGQDAAKRAADPKDSSGALIVPPTAGAKSK